MGRFRDAFESQMLPDRRRHSRYGHPATAAAVAGAERALRLSLPEPLRELYADFDGLWYDETRVTPPDDDTEWWEVLPLRLLPTARDTLVRQYGRAARDRLVATFGPAEEEGYNDFEGQLGRCVAFFLPEHGASFKFMTDLGAWGIAPGRVGSWSHDGGVYDSTETPEEWFAEIGWMRSRGQ